jgi:hypothetical protein
VISDPVIFRILICNFICDFGVEAKFSFEIDFETEEDFSTSIPAG